MLQTLRVNYSVVYLLSFLSLLLSDNPSFNKTTKSILPDLITFQLFLHFFHDLISQ